MLTAPSAPSTREWGGPLDSDRHRRSVRQFLLVVAGSHTGAFIGSTVPNFGLPGDVFSLLLVAVLFVLPFLVEAKSEQLEGAWFGLVD